MKPIARCALLLALVGGACSSGSGAQEPELGAGDDRDSETTEHADVGSVAAVLEAGSPRLEPLSVGDGTTVTRVTASDGSVFALRLPESFGLDLQTLEDPTSGSLAEVRGPGFGAQIQIGFCADEPVEQNRFGLLAAVLPAGEPAAPLRFCRPDEFVRLVIDPVPDVAFTMDQFHLVPLIAGKIYAGWMHEQGQIHGQCCFEDRGPSWYRDTMIVSNGNLDGQITAMDGGTLQPLWTTDLVAELQTGQEWVGDGSFLMATTESGVVIATTGYGFLVGLSAETGSLLWRADLEGESSILMASTADEKLLVASDVTSEGDQSAPSLRLIDNKTGEIIWVSKGEPSTDLQWTSPVVMNDLVLVADVPSYQPEPETDETATAHLLAFDVATGARRWITSLDSAAEAFSTSETIVTESATGLILAMNTAGVVFRFDPATGAELWRTRGGFGEIVGLSPDAVTIVASGREVDVDLETGKPL